MNRVIYTLCLWLNWPREPRMMPGACPRFCGLYAGLKYGEYSFNLLDANTTPPDMEQINAEQAGNDFGLCYP